MERKSKAALAGKALQERYPEAACSLAAGEPFQLLAAVRLSAQCTDARVNLVTPALFERYPDVNAFAQADVREVETYIHSCGFYRQKASDLVETAKIIRDRYNGVLPDSIEELTKLPGVGRKTANLLVGDIYGKPAVVCDTHMIRLANRLGLADSKDPYKVEMALREVLDLRTSSEFCHRAVLFGREICSARNPKCGICPMLSFCQYGTEHSNTDENREIRFLKTDGKD